MVLGNRNLLCRHEYVTRRAVMAPLRTFRGPPGTVVTSPGTYTAAVAATGAKSSRPITAHGVLF